MLGGAYKGRGFQSGGKFCVQVSTCVLLDSIRSNIANGDHALCKFQVSKHVCAHCEKISKFFSPIAVVRRARFIFLQWSRLDVSRASFLVLYFKSCKIRHSRVLLRSFRCGSLTFTRVCVCFPNRRSASSTCMTTKQWTTWPHYTMRVAISVWRFRTSRRTTWCPTTYS